MFSYNRVLLVGRLTRDPDLRKLASGSSVASLSLALTDAYRNSAGERVEKACFVDVEAWNDQAENCGKYLKKGRPVLVDGKLQLDEWEGKNGERRQKLKVRAQSILFLDSDPGGNGQGEVRDHGGGKRPAQKSQPAVARVSVDEGEPPF